MTTEQNSGASNVKAGRQVPQQRSAVPGRGGFLRVLYAFVNSCRGIYIGALSESSIKQEFYMLAVGSGLSFFLAQNIWQWLALIGSLLLILTAEFLNTAIERLCNHVTPYRDEAIRDVKDLASAAVFFTLLFALLVWGGVFISNFFLLS